MDINNFILNIGTAFLIGAVIGLERQFRQHPAGLRTNTLVSVGAALFVSLTYLMDDKGSPTRIASYVVSGVGFLGGGVILREGLNVRGMSTAATLWCSAAVGTIAGAGFPLHALVGTALVLGIHLVLRPIAFWIDLKRQRAVDVETSYRIRIVCPQDQERIIRTILMRHINSHPKMTIQGISSEEASKDDHATVVADVFSLQRNERVMEELLSRLNIEPDIISVRWEKTS